jgi:hypothetical protein
MTFEEQLTRAFETLTERLRGEIHQHVQRTSAELVAAAPYDRDPKVIEAARQELEVAVAAVRQETHDAAWHEAHEQGFAAGRDAGRREAQVESAPVTVSPPGDDFQRLANAMRAIDAAGSLAEMLDTLVSLGNQQASHATVWLLRSGQLRRWDPSGAEDGRTSAVQPLDAGGPIADAAASNATARDEHVMAVPIALAGQVVAIFSANRESPNGSVHPPADGLELLVRYTAKSLEALTAFKTARALTEHAEPVAPLVPVVVADDASDEEDTSARRYARLLVSEIKLYHETAVVEGRRDRDLGSRLGGEIARARVMYEQRVPAHVRAGTDYFKDELVRTLADGDASLLEVRSQKAEVRSEI